MARTPPQNPPKTFKAVVEQTGTKPHLSSGQHASRHYSETLSAKFALWIRELVSERLPRYQVLLPEARVPTIYGSKSLDVAALDGRGYVVLDVSIKTFNFKDAKTGNYRHNYTGRFYELLGEELDIRRSYKWATMVAMVILPIDSCDDTVPSSFAHAVRQYSKIAVIPGRERLGNEYEFVFIGLHNQAGDIYFFDASTRPPLSGPPPTSQRLSPARLMDLVMSEVSRREKEVAAAEMPEPDPFFPED